MIKRKFPKPARRVRRVLALALLQGAFAGCAWAQAIPAYLFASPLLPLLLQMPENSWLQVNANLYSNVWTPAELEPLDNGVTHTPSKIILAWSGFAWDSNRGDLVLYGGGHANYSGNDVYRWRSTTLQWERAAYPSEISCEPATLRCEAIDGVDNAPISAHTYDNNIFLSVADRVLTWGGASYNDGWPYTRPSETDPSTLRTTGPYLFDPNRADGNKVGGSTGSHVKRVAPHPEIVGGQMWQNRDLPKNLAGQAMPGSNGSGCALATTEGGKDVVYLLGANFVGAGRDVYRYQLTTLADATQDHIAKVGSFSGGPAGTTTCGYDPARKLFVRTGSNSVPFLFWDLTVPSPTNPERTVQVEATISGFRTWLAGQGFDITNCALKFDPVRRVYPLWCGGATTWELRAPAAGNTDSGWTIAQRPAPTGLAPSTADQAIGILGKWRYAPYYDAFVALENVDDGDVWIYKPVGWLQPNPAGNALPTVSLTSPPAGALFAPRAQVNLTAAASDPDGTIARVEYYVNGSKVGQATTPPFALAINPIPVGTYTVIAIAVDNLGGMTKSAPITFTVSAPLTTKTLQRGLGGYAGVADTYLDGVATATVRGTSNPLYLALGTMTPLLRFAVFAAEGGPVPDGAVIQSATLSLYKQYYDDTLRLDALLKPWTESQATWMVRQTGVPWSASGAAGAGSDYDTASDDVFTPSFYPGWIDIDVTARVQRWTDVGGNNGWRLAQTTSGTNAKTFYSSEYAADPTLRPKLTVVYSVPAPNVPPTVALTSPAGGARIVLGASFGLAANAADSDGIAKVEFFANGVSIGQDTVAPYTLNWTPAAVGTYVLTAVATDTRLLSTTSAAVTVYVDPAGGGTTVVLQRGLAGYAGVSDTFLDNALRTTVRGSFNPLYLDPVNYNPLLRFAIFAAEGGPVPDGAVIQSATLSLYKQYYSDTVRLNALLKPWTESQATWTVRQTGVAWSVGGAGGAGSDYNATNDALVTAGFNPGWVSFNVTARVAQWGSGGGNNGWRLAQTTSGINAKTFYSSEYAADPTLRPKLTVVYR